MIKTERNLILYLESLVMKRFTIEGLKEELEKKLEKEIVLELIESDNDTIDYNLIFNYENEYIFCDVDIYYAITRAKELYITEVGYEFQ